jgi:hypothetical protein
VLRSGTSRAFRPAPMKMLRELEVSRAWTATGSQETFLCGYDLRRNISLGILCLAALVEINCGTAGSPPTTPVPPSSVGVTVTPPSASVVLGSTQQFQAIVTGSSNTSVTWEVNGATGGAANSGTISAAGLYAAPAILPSPPGVTVTAVSQVDTQASGSANVALTDNIAVTVLPSAVNVPTGGAQVFTANETATGDPAAGFTWSVNGVAGGNSSVGTIATTSSTTALYTAPPAPPSPPTVTVIAASAADGSKSGSAAATITCAAANSISLSSTSVGLDQSQTFAASFCLPAGAGIVWDVNGIAAGNSTLGTIVPSGASTALYTAPADLPGVNPVTIHATVSPQPSGGQEFAAATVTITSGVTVSVTPPTATLSVGQRASFSANVANSADTMVSWSVGGVPNGNASVGQACVSGTNPCASPADPSSAVDFLAPNSVPANNPVALTATSNADPSRSGAAMVTIAGSAGPVAVAISPAFAFVPPSTGTPSTQPFFATVKGSNNSSVTWSVESAVAGQGCAGAACGSVDANGVYSAPTAAPSPNAIAVIATSQADSTKSASAAIAITSGPAIEVILPSSVMAGAVDGFPLEVEGVNFVAGSGSSASAILIDGVARSTTCSAATACATSLNPSDVESAGTLTIQVQNPGTPPPLSNPVAFVTVPFDVSEDMISLDSAQPVATGNDIIVVEPTTAAASSPINVNFIGLLTSGNACCAQGSPLTIARPASGSATISICVSGNGLDPTFTYAFTGPSSAPDGSDIGVTASAVAGLFPGSIELDLQIASTTLPGVRTLVITTLNNDRAIATGMLEVQ